MPILRLLAACLAIAALVGTTDVHARKRSSTPEPREAPTVAGRYDYYIMALSWSPTFCQSQRSGEDEQCGNKRYGFILHGLWPQYESGGGPDRCDSLERTPDRNVVAATLPFMPSRRLINHEWRKHGTCTGLDAKAYFQTADRAFATVQVPRELQAPRKALDMTGDQLRGALRRANPALRDDMMTLHCSHGQLVEVRVCMDRDTQLRSCGKRLRNSCPAQRPFEIPAVR